DESLVTAVHAAAGAACHHICVDVYWIHRIRHGDADVGSEDFLNISAVAFRSIAHENLAGIDLSAARAVVIGSNGLAQESISLFRTVAMKAFSGAHLVDRSMHGVAAGLGQRLGDVANAEADNRALRIGLLKRGHALADVGKKVRRLELEVVFVDANHKRWKS